MRERARLTSLYPDLALPSEATDKSFAREEQGFVAAELADFVLQTIGKGYDMAGIDDDLAVNVLELNHRSEGVEPEVSRTGATDKEEGFPGEEALRKPLPFRLQLDRGRGRDVG